MSDALTVRQELSQVLSPEDISEGGLSQQTGREVGIAYVGHRGDGVTDSEVHHSVHTNCNRVLGQDLR